MEPKNELELIAVFAAECAALGYEILSIDPADFPDAVVFEATSGCDLLVEFELKARNFKLHKHDASLCDLIVCWENNWIDAPLPVLALAPPEALKRKPKRGRPRKPKGRGIKIDFRLHTADHSEIVARLMSQPKGRRSAYIQRILANTPPEILDRLLVEFLADEKSDNEAKV